MPTGNPSPTGMHSRRPATRGATAHIVTSERSGREVRIGPLGDFQKFESEDHTVTVWMAGKTFSPDPPEAGRQAIAEYLKEGRRPSPPRFLGRFALIFFDALTLRVWLVTDRYGFQPLYRFHAGRVLWLSTSLGWLRRSCQLVGAHDLAAIGDLMTFKYVLGERTLLKGVSRIPPASIGSADPETHEMSFATYWDPVEILAGDRTPLAAAEETLINAFVEGVSRVAPRNEKVGLFLSGGLDSRVMLAGVLHLGLNVIAKTGGIEGGHDHRISCMLADALGFEHEFGAMNADYARQFFPMTAEAARFTDGMLLTDGAGHRFEANNAPVNSPRFFFHGAEGELARLRHLHHFPVDRAVLKARPDEIADVIVNRFLRQHERTRQVLRADVRSGIGMGPIERLGAHIRALSERIEPPDVPSVLAIREHARNSVAYSFLTARDRFDFWSPFLAPDYLDALLRVRTRDRLVSTFHVHLLKRLNPELAGFPESETACRPGRPDWFTKLPRVWMGIQSRLGSDATKGHEDFAAWLRYMDPPAEEVLLHPACSLFDPIAIQALVARSRSGDEGAANEVQRLLTLAVWCRSDLIDPQDAPGAARD